MENKAYYDKYDIMKRYDVGRTVAERIIRQIKSANGGGMLSKGKVLPTELKRWEALPISSDAMSPDVPSVSSPMDA